MNFYSELSMEAKQWIVDAAKNLKAEGLSSKQIADKLCLSESVLRRIKKDIANTNKPIG